MPVLDEEEDDEDNLEENPEDIFDMLQARHAEDSTESAAKQDAGTEAGSVFWRKYAYCISRAMNAIKAVMGLLGLRT